MQLDFSALAVLPVLDHAVEYALLWAQIARADTLSGGRLAINKNVSGESDQV